jgi:hypothetical protein
MCWPNPKWPLKTTVWLISHGLGDVVFIGSAPRLAEDVTR